MTHEAFRIRRGNGPLVAVAVHDGHETRDEVTPLLALSEDERRREEDPFTGEWTALADNSCVALRSRFEVDLNRPRDRAVYRSPGDAWGLTVWNDPPPDELIQRSLAQYDAFYEAMHDLLSQVERRHGAFVVYDLHSYNHRRADPDGPAADPEQNPQVNLGTGTMDRARWSPVVDRFMAELRGFDFPGGALDVRENVKFQGGHFARWVHGEFSTTGCVLAIEFKKFFMDEWTGVPHQPTLHAITAALRATVPGVLEGLQSR